MASSTQASLEALYRSHGHLVLRRARQILGSEQEARDALQELFVSLLSRPAQFEGRSAATTFLYAATTNLCLNRLRNGRNRLRLVEANAPTGEGPPPHSPERAESLAEARALLARLPDELREVAVYCFFDELTQEETAQVMGCSRRHVNNLLVRLRTRVAELVAAEPRKDLA